MFRWNAYINYTRNHSRIWDKTILITYQFGKHLNGCDIRGTMYIIASHGYTANEQHRRATKEYDVSPK